MSSHACPWHPGGVSKIQPLREGTLLGIHELVAVAPLKRTQYPVFGRQRNLWEKPSVAFLEANFLTSLKGLGVCNPGNVSEIRPGFRGWGQQSDQEEGSPIGRSSHSGAATSL